MSAPVHYRNASIRDDRSGAIVKMFYREAGPKDAPAVLLLHGFPTSSHQYRGLIDRLSDKYRVVAPDFPGFGLSDAPDAKSFEYTFEHLAQITESFTDAVGLSLYALYIFDYGAPVGLRLALSRPECISALITQNGNAYEEGLSDGWTPVRTYWQNPTEQNRDNLRSFLQAGTTRNQYEHGEPDISLIAPETYTLDQHFLDRVGNADIQLDLLGDYKSNVASYPRFQEYLRAYQPPTLAVWGKNDPYFLPEGAEAFRRDLPQVQIHFVNAGHFPLETHLDEVATHIRAFLARILDKAQGEALFGPLDEESVPVDGRDLVAGTGAMFGFVPKLSYAFGAEPVVMKAYLDMLHSLGQTCLTRIEQEVAMAAASRVNAGDYALAVHVAMAKKLGAPAEVVEVMRSGGPFADQKLEAVSRFAAAIASNKTQVSDSEVRALTAAGYDRRAVMAIALAAGAKTLANTVAHLAQVEVEENLNAKSGSAK